MHKCLMANFQQDYRTGFDDKLMIHSTLDALKSAFIWHIYISLQIDVNLYRTVSVHRFKYGHIVCSQMFVFFFRRLRVLTLFPCAPVLSSTCDQRLDFFSILTRQSKLLLSTQHGAAAACPRTEDKRVAEALVSFLHSSKARYFRSYSEILHEYSNSEISEIRHDFC